MRYEFAIQFRVDDSENPELMGLALKTIRELLFTSENPVTMRVGIHTVHGAFGTIMRMPE